MTTPPSADQPQARSCCRSARRQASAPVASPEFAAEFEAELADLPRANAGKRAELRARLKNIPGGFFDLGTRVSRYETDFDSPRQKVKISPFLLSPTTVSNADYAHFVEATGYKTIAEREGWTYVFHLLLPEPALYPNHPPGLSWWRQVHGGYWAAPEGPGSTIQDREDHPAVHLCWYDALAYCTWAGLRLPTEAEWERAARGGKEHLKFPWGNELTPGGKHQMNIFQGQFPAHNSAEDGFIGTAPVTAFAPNGYGLYNMTGNVWEWTSDWFGPRPPAGKLPARDPKGPASGRAKVTRGGSYLCHVSYCDRYHVHSRSQNDPDSSTGNIGFRVAADV